MTWRDAPLATLARSSRGLYGERPILVREWLRTISELWKLDRSAMLEEVFPKQVPAALELDHVGAIVSGAVELRTIELLGCGYQCRQFSSEVMASELGTEVTILEGTAPSAKVELFVPKVSGPRSQSDLVTYWGRLGIGVHVGFAASSLKQLYKSVRLFMDQGFVCTHGIAWNRAEGKAVSYLDGFVSSERLRIEVCF